MRLFAVWADSNAFASVTTSAMDLALLSGGSHSVIVEAKDEFVTTRFVAEGAIRTQAASVSNLDFPCLN